MNAEIIELYALGEKTLLKQTYIYRKLCTLEWGKLEQSKSIYGQEEQTCVV